MNISNNVNIISKYIPKKSNPSSLIILLIISKSLDGNNRKHIFKTASSLISTRPTFNRIIHINIVKSKKFISIISGKFIHTNFTNIKLITTKKWNHYFIKCSYINIKLREMFDCCQYLWVGHHHGARMKA